MRLYYFAIGVVIVTLLCAFAGHAIAQSAPFTITGEVIDANGNPVPGANVTLIDNNYNVLGVKTTGQDGTYGFINVISNTGTVTVRVNFTNDGVAYTVPSYYTLWYPAQGIQTVPANQTQIPNYPPPAYGYVWGAIETTDNQFIDGVVYLNDINTGDTYYEFANNTNGESSFSFYVPAGNYWLYAQHYQYGAIYESVHQMVNVTRSYSPNEVLPYQINISLDTPSANPDPSIVESPNANVVSGTVLYSNGTPAANATVTLYEKSDNGTVFLPTNYTTATDGNGNYTFSGVVPTSDGGVVIQSSKPIEAGVEYYDSSGTLWSVYSTPETLYYPDVILGYGREDAARNISMPTITVSEMATPQPSVYAGPTNTASASSSGLAAGPFAMAVIIGLICLTGVYFLLYRKS